MHISDKKRTIIRVHYPREFGKSLTIRGIGGGKLSWDVCSICTWVTDPLKGDRWELELESDSEENIIFKPVLLGHIWAKGPNYVCKAGEEVNIYPFFHQNKGTIIQINGFYSDIFGNTRKLIVYLPPSYYENVYKRYPVLLMNDGHNVFMSEGSFSGQHWGIGETMDNLCSNQNVREHIIVGIVPIDRSYEYLPTRCQTPFGMNGGGADKYLDFIAKELKPYIVSNFRTFTPLLKVGIAGSSFGGLISYYAWLSRPHEFDLCGAFSPSISFDNRLCFRLLEKEDLQRGKDSKLYIDSGSPNDGYVMVKQMEEAVQNKINKGWIDQQQFLYVVGEGHNHNERSWALRAPRALSFLFEDKGRESS